MLDKLTSSLEEQATAWIAAFDAALSGGDEETLADLLETDSHWRNLSGISWPIATYDGARRIAGELLTRAAEAGASDFKLDPELLFPRRNVIAQREVVEAIFRFQTDNGPGLGVVRLIVSSKPGTVSKAWTLSTALDMDRICETRTEGSALQWHAPDFAGPSWQERRRAEAAYSDREPDVLVVGGGHAGVTAAAELKRLGHDVLVIDRLPRVGDNWRLRYNGLRLHNKFPVNHFRYMPFPITMPDYLPKDKVANWIEAYVDSMDLNFWTGTSFETAVYDDESRLWTARVSQAEGDGWDLRPKHIIMATSVSATPNIPTIPTIERYEGPLQHSSEFASGAAWAGKSVLVIGSGTSAHDICQDLHAHGARATMVQRSSTLVVNVEPSAQIYDAIYLGDGPPLDVRDLLNSSIPYPVAKAVHKLITRQVKQLDAPLLQRLEKVGFKLDFGEDETGWPLKFRTRGGGYYFNVGCSDLIAEGSVGLIQADQIEQFTDDGVELKGGLRLQADLIVLGTGYKGHDHLVRSCFGDEVAERVGPIWGLDPVHHELRNMWTRTGQPGLWFTGGAFSMSRIYSRFMALQIDAIEDGRLEK